MINQNLVLVPGLVCDAQVWRHQVKHLKGIANIAVVPAPGKETMSEIAADALRDAPDTFALAGFSMGGYVALEMLRQAPNRVTRLALLDTSAKADTEEKTATRMKAIQACNDGNYEDVIQGMFKVLLHPDHQHGDLRPFVTDMAKGVGAESFTLRHQAMTTRSDSRDLICALDIPVRAICGRQDAMSPIEDHIEIAELATNGRFSVIEECGHMTILERPHATTALLRDWLLYD
jgi:pimeloyl-ACP methyl ester carboxylesterase